jgi:hypothetical protein
MLLLGEDRSASKALKGVGGEADKVASKSSKMSTGSKAALAAAGAAAAKFGKDSVDAYIEASESQRALEDAYKRYPQLADVNIEQRCATSGPRCRTRPGMTRTTSPRRRRSWRSTN